MPPPCVAVPMPANALPDDALTLGLKLPNACGVDVGSSDDEDEDEDKKEEEEEEDEEEEEEEEDEEAFATARCARRRYA